MIAKIPKKLKTAAWLVILALIVIMLWQIPAVRTLLVSTMGMKTRAVLHPTAISITEIRGMAELVSIEWHGEVVSSSYEDDLKKAVNELREFYLSLQRDPKRKINLEEYRKYLLLRDCSPVRQDKPFGQYLLKTRWEDYMIDREMFIVKKLMDLYRGPRVSYLARGKVQAGVDLSKTERLLYEEATGTLKIMAPVEVLAPPMINPIFIEDTRPPIPGYELIEGDELDLGDPEVGVADDRARKNCRRKLLATALSDGKLLQQAKTTAEEILEKSLRYFTFNGKEIRRVVFITRAEI